MLCFRLFSENNPAVPLADAVAQLREGQAPKDLYAVEPASFQQIPNAPFAYWVSERIRRLFVELPAFEGEGRTVRQGLATANDFRFVRAAWEVPAETKSNSSKKWFVFAKGGSFSPYYADLFLKVNWCADGAECKEYIILRYPYLNGNAEFVAKNTQYYSRPGITWPRRTDGLSFRVLPAGSVFADKGPAAFMANNELDRALELLGLCNSGAFDIALGTQLARVELARSFEVGLVQSTPVPVVTSKTLGPSVRKAWSTKRNSDTSNLTSHAFCVPALAPCRSIKKSSRA